MEAQSVDHPLRAGVLVGEYRVLGKLGEGGMATVYLATHPKLDNRVAVKVLSTQLSCDPRAVARFEQEARILSRLKHPGIVSAYSFGELPDGRRYYVMEHLEGQSLREHLAQQGALPPDMAVEVIAQVASALDAAHARGVLHRDVKPENVFLDRGGAVKLLDFGIAKLLDDGDRGLTRAGQFLGSPNYMSPEQRVGQALDARSDLYSLSAVAFECLSGVRPNDSAAVAARWAALGTPSPQGAGDQVLPTLASVCPALPRGLSVAIARGLSLAPAARYQTGAALVAELRSALGLAEVHPTSPIALNPPGEHPTADGPVQLSRLQREGRTQTHHQASERRMTRLIVAGLALLSLSTLAFVWARSRSRSRSHPTTAQPSPVARVPTPLDAGPVQTDQRTADSAPPRDAEPATAPGRSPRRKRLLRKSARSKKRAKDRDEEGHLIRF